jgi:glycosidase
MDEVSTYFLMIDRFENGNPENDGGIFGASRLRAGYDPADISFFHGGDFVGIADRLQYIKDLGFNAIWITPPVKNISGGFGSAAYHGYSGVDFTTVDSRFGSEEDFRDLIEIAHRKGMKVFVDVVVNHTADVIQPSNGDTSYIEMRSRPYRDSSGARFKLSKEMKSGKIAFPRLDPRKSFPKRPISSPAPENQKYPAFLRDLTNYHNRGDSTFQGESVEFGDFYGLDDLFTEKPAVVKGWISAWSRWITDFDIDGMRIDTYKHVNKEFWSQFIPAIQRVAKNSGKENFPIFGEVYDADPAALASYVREVSAPSVLDFAFQNRVERYVSNGIGAEELAQLFNDDDFYTTSKFNAKSLATFLGNHDMGRIGLFIKKRNPYASPQELLERSELAMAMLFLLRGSAVGYYGDEKGLIGDPGDKGARQNLFPTKVLRWQNEERIGMESIGESSSFDVENPLQSTISQLQSFVQSNNGYRVSSQRTRFANQGGFVVSRRTDGKEFWLAFNSSDKVSQIEMESVDLDDAKVEIGKGSYSNQVLTLPPRSYTVFTQPIKSAKPANEKWILSELESGFGPLNSREFGVTSRFKDEVLVSFYLRSKNDSRFGEWEHLGSSNRPTFQTAHDLGNFYRIFVSEKRLRGPSQLIALISGPDGKIQKSNLLSVATGR